MPDFVGGLGAEKGLDAEAASKLKVGPVVKGIAQGVGNGLGVGVELFPRGGVTGDMGFGNAIGSHCAPFVVVEAEPEVGDIFPTLIVGHFSGREVGVIIKDGQALCRIVKKLTGRLGEEKEVVVKVCSSHGRMLEQSPQQVQGRII